MKNGYVYKMAETESEFSQIHRLNYDTFAKEIPQHPINPDEILVDRFHKENAYFICVKGGELTGMLAARSKRPFSLDSKISGLDSFLPPHASACEIRLLSIRKNHRAGRILAKLIGLVAQFCKEKGHDLLVISGTLRQMKLYRHIGFIPFGPVVGTPDASYQPMYLKLSEDVYGMFLECDTQKHSPQGKSNFLPGPVGIRPEVYKALASTTLSHRSHEYINLHKTVKRMLCSIVNAGKVELFLGSGTLANDVVAGQLSLLERKGLILTNGEFGNRLIDHAERFGLDFETLSVPHGQAFDSNKIRMFLKANPHIRWVWFVHCETSTGILNNLALMKEITKDSKAVLCADCVSSIGAVKVDLSDVYLASCVSGKCLGAFPGISMVFYNHDLARSAKKLPRYMDLGFYAEKGGMPFTGSYNLINALHKALLSFDIDMKMKEAAANSSLIIRELRKLGFEPVGDTKNLISTVITLELPELTPSAIIAEVMSKRGVYISYNSEYLRRKNRLQICLMGSVTRYDIDMLLKCFQELRHHKDCFLTGARSET